MKTRFILNPCSGRNATRPWLAEFIRKFIREHRVDGTIVVTAAAGHATVLARNALIDGCDRVVAVGGDGTMNEVAQALVHTSTALAFVPCGSGNGLARHLRVPIGLQQALETAVAPSSAVATIDTATANGHPFFNAMGCGFDAEISRRFNRLKRRGLPAYIRTGFSAFLQRQSEAVLVRSGKHTFSGEILLITVANSEQYGNGALIAPGAVVSDGQMDLVAIRPLTTLSALPLVARLFLGSLYRSRHVEHIRGPHFSIVRSKAGPIHTDGETHTTSAAIDICVRPRSLRIIVPAGSNLGSPAPQPIRQSELQSL
jgi:diacylglycerol kinase (ATP)